MENIMASVIVEGEKIIGHPAEAALDIEPNTTVVPFSQVTTDLVVAAEYDPKDVEIEQQFQTIYDVALTAFESSRDTAEIVDPKFAARNAEVAAVYLNTALAAAKEKAMLKQHKDKIEQSAGAKTVNNTVVIADRNELLRQMFNPSLPTTTEEPTSTK